ncbi:hypothetical protein DMH04_42845 [Kibdelosporangium aridum]|uniref:Uncharacterized protein n=1 Tax=Kibdelosporangium aridum TaxID=2030 RepID=A0A428YT11_KIBAR|nr:hypothetical protein [Kibdelosporangium aridum]RSM72375.1 hypothetical protein DMH04_42845 [Kibdelosporangium aridum]
MAWFNRRKKRTSAEEMREVIDDVVRDLAEDDRVQSKGPRFWLDHGFVNGDRVECAVCDKPLVVRLVKYSRVILATTDTQTGSPLICGDCGRLLCLDCALRLHPHRPSCDRCRRVGGVTSLMK